MVHPPLEIGLQLDMFLGFYQYAFFKNDNVIKLKRCDDVTSI